MILAGKIYECDFTQRKFATPTNGYLLFARGETGRVCHVAFACREAFDSEPEVLTYEQLVEVAESVPGGYLDY